MTTTWIKSGSISASWTCICSSSSGQYLAAAYTDSGGSIYTSSNFGSTWVKTSAQAANWTAICSDSTGQYLTAAIVNGFVYSSSDYGSTWTQTTLPSSGWQGVSSSSSGQYLAALSFNTNARYSSDFGVTWNTSTFSTNTNLSIASNSSGQYVVLAIANGEVWRSSNYGQTFVRVLSTGIVLKSVCSDSTGQYLATCGTGFIYTSFNFGSNWTQRATSRLWLSICSDSTGQYLHAGVNGGNIFSSYDYGVTWTVSSSLLLAWRFMCSKSDGTLSFAAANGSFIYIGTYAPIPYPCFKEDTLILTNKGYRRIQELRKGDLVKTLLNGYLKIDMIGKRNIDHKARIEDRIKNQLYKCSHEKFKEVFEPLVLTGCHSILVDEFVSEEQKQKAIKLNENRLCVTDHKYRLPACLDERTTVYEIPGTYTIYHLALENPDYYMNYGIYANGLLVETCSRRYLKELSGMELIE